MTLRARLFPIAVIAGFLALAATAISQAAADPLADAVKRSGAQPRVVLSDGHGVAARSAPGYGYFGSKTAGFELLQVGDRSYIGVDGCWYDGTNGDISKQASKSRKGKVVSSVLAGVLMLPGIKKAGASQFLLDSLRDQFAGAAVRRGRTITAARAGERITVTLDRSGRITRIVSSTDGSFDVTYPRSIRRVSAQPLCKI